jgi:hypothetical protein|uniref:Uncharacterized protein n=1 Tax=viral metagenome TaxID=1070528 RepID=A0A6C0IX20_9ZZZZ
MPRTTSYGTATISAAAGTMASTFGIGLLSAPVTVGTLST